MVLLGSVSKAGVTGSYARRQSGQSANAALASMEKAKRKVTTVNMTTGQTTVTQPAQATPNTTRQPSKSDLQKIEQYNEYIAQRDNPAYRLQQSLGARNQQEYAAMLGEQLRQQVVNKGQIQEIAHNFGEQEMKLIQDKLAAKAQERKNLEQQQTQKTSNAQEAVQEWAQQKYGTKNTGTFSPIINAGTSEFGKEMLLEVGTQIETLGSGSIKLINAIAGSTIPITKVLYGEKVAQSINVTQWQTPTQISVGQKTVELKAKGSIFADEQALSAGIFWATLPLFQYKAVRIIGAGLSAGIAAKTFAENPTLGGAGRATPYLIPIVAELPEITTTAKTGFKVATAVVKGVQYVKKTNVFAPEVLSGKKTFSYSQSAEQTLKEFRATQDKGLVWGVHSTKAEVSPQETIVKTGKAVQGKEDVGLYVAPYGRGSARFLGILKSKGYEAVSPLKAYAEQWKEALGLTKPQALSIGVGSVERYPKSVIEKAGFGVVEAYQKSRLAENVAFITKKSELLFKAGKTAESEAVIPVDKTIMQVGEQFTIIEGRYVPIKEYIVVERGVGVPATKKVSAAEFVKESEKGSAGLSYVKSSYSRSIGPFGPITASALYPQSSVSQVEVTSSVFPEASQAKSSITPQKIKLSSYPVLAPQSKSSIIVPIESSRTVRGGSSTPPPSLPGGGSSITQPPVSPPPPSLPGGRSSITQPPSTPPSFSIGRVGKQAKRELYSVLVRRKGVFKTIATVPTFEQAFKLGKIKVQNTAAASFKIKTVSASSNGVNKSLLPVSFYASKREPGTFIQKRGFRISSAGEKREITMKGIFVNRQKKARTKLWGF